MKGRRVTPAESDAMMQASAVASLAAELSAEIAARRATPAPGPTPAPEPDAPEFSYRKPSMRGRAPAPPVPRGLLHRLRALLGIGTKGKKETGV